MTEQMELIKPVYVLEISVKGQEKKLAPIEEQFDNIFGALKRAIRFLEEDPDYVVLGIRVDGEYVINRPSLFSIWLLLGRCPDGYWITEEGE